MPALCKKQLIARGISDENLAMAEQIQTAQRASGGRVQSLAQICGISDDPQRGRTVQAGASVDLDEITRKALRGARSHAELMAIHARLTALQADGSPYRDQIRDCASQLEELAGGVQLEFEFSIWEGNVIQGHQYLDQMIARLTQLQNDGYEWKPGRKMTDANRLLCMAVLQLIGRHLEWQGPRCQVTASEISEALQIDKMQVSRAVKALEEIGAIETGPAPTNRSKKIIIVTPDGIYRGRMSKDRKEHTAAVEDFEKERARIRSAKAAAAKKPKAKARTEAVQLSLLGGQS
jgi:DNA-binding MarR family transcriptional regulator